MRRESLVNMFVWGCLVLAVTLLAAALGFRVILLRLGYGTTSGTIVEKLPNDHLGLEFTYVVDGRRYQGSGYVGQINRSFEDVRLADEVTVFYSTRNPAVSSLENPNFLFAESLLHWFGAAAIFSVMGMCVLHRYRFLPECRPFRKCRLN